MAVRVVEFSNGGIKLERFLPKNQHIQRKLLNFEKMSITKNVLLNWYSSMKKKLRNIRMIFDIEN